MKFQEEATVTIFLRFAKAKNNKLHKAKQGGTMEIRLIVCGGRDFCDYEFFKARMDELIVQYSNVQLVSGHARGADSLAEKYAAENGLRVKVFPAEWQKYGRAAGPIRNKAMLEYAMEDTPVVAAFWDGKSRGTGNMLKLAEKAGVECHVFSYGKQ